MWKTGIVCALLASGSFAPQQLEPLPVPGEGLKEEAVWIESSATNGEAVVVVEAESEEELERVEARAPNGFPVFGMRAADGAKFPLSGFVIESSETSLSELFAKYPAGTYELRARASDGRPLYGSAVLSHALPATPSVSYPSGGELDVPCDALTVTWSPDPSVARYHVGLEQGESDGLSVEVPGSSGQLVVPPGVLAPGRRTRLEVAAIGANGNRTVVEVLFRTD